MADLDDGAKPDALVGVISDTHGTLDRRVACAFRGVDHILHAGDIGSAEVLWELETLAPVTAVLGNTDGDLPGYRLGTTARLEIAGVRFLVAHKPEQLEEAVLLMDADVAVHGHTHAPSVRERDGILIVNPGTASRGGTAGEPSTVAVIELRGGTARARIAEL